MNIDRQVYFWAHMLDEVFDKTSFLLEDKEGKNINKAEKYIKDNFRQLIGTEIDGHKMNSARDIITKIREKIPSSRLPYDLDANGQKKTKKRPNGEIIVQGTCKYLLGICRLYLKEIPTKAGNDQRKILNLVDRLNDLVQVIATQFNNDFTEDDKGKDFNGMSFDELETKYGNATNELKKKEREDTQKALSKKKKNEDYTIVKIDSFEDAKKFSPYVSWCVTKDEDYFNDYTYDGLKDFYFAIRKDFKDISEDDPSYKDSMLAILVDPEGNMDSSNGCTSRLNDGGRHMNPAQVQDLLGVDFYATFSDKKKAKRIKHERENANKKVEDILSKVDEIDENTIPEKLKKLITDIKIPNNVTSIMEKAFASCIDLMSVTIPDSVISIGNGAFFGCSSLTGVTIGNGVKDIGDEAFSGCSSLTSITIPNSVTNIRDYTFEFCSGLTSVTIPDNVTSIGSFAFAGCSNLTSVTIPNSVMNIEKYAFYDCKNLKELVFKGKTLDEVKYMKNSPFGIRDKSIIKCVS